MAGEPAARRKSERTLLLALASRRGLAGVLVSTVAGAWPQPSFHFVAPVVVSVSAYNTTRGAANR
jgi:hypothetical protein